MHSFKGCDCLTDSYFDPPVVGEIDHLYLDQRSSGMNADVRNWYHKQSICFYNRTEYEKTAITIVEDPEQKPQAAPA
ncbi:hypothetical protein VNO80_00074 [Phaseolus coccineus]|uniref:Uncharacterized protein n=1 Tax=Phaseolus coccineus TaxID=3886 RepID=A0AAN9RQL6_PHACN